MIEKLGFLNMRMVKGADAAMLDSAFENFNVGMRVQLRTQRDTGTVEHFSSLIGFVKGEFLMVKCPMVRNTPFILNDGEQVLVRAFTGTTIHSFPSIVIRTLLSPLYYMHLEYPQAMHSSALRAELRIKVSAPAEIEYKDLTGSKASNQATLVDLSLSGARIASEDLISVGNKVQLSFAVQSDDVEHVVRAKAVVRSAKRNPAARFDDRDTFSYGLQFESLDSEDQAAIRLMTYETVLSNRQNIA
ncbi:flagellar brake protein [Noviherbaspirillum sp. 1P10PC]|uniref:flagellar brake protein n=1 Tax=Noviherbaspirillum sp. 1P10PC TaxID=3132292 RepID=UPI0039A08587